MTYRAAAWYAIDTLLRPLGLHPSEHAPGPGLWYGEAPPAEPGWIHIRLDPRTPLGITGCQPQVSTPSMNWGGRSWPVLFPGGIEEEGDVIASAFYWLAGCDERGRVRRDRFGRPSGVDSLLQSLESAQHPPVDAYRERLSEHLARAGIQHGRRTWRGASWCLSPTFDIDYFRKWRRGILYREWVQYLLLGKGPGRKPARALRGLVEWVSGRDPYREALTRIPATLERHQGAGSFLFKAGAHGPHDVSYRLESRAMRHILSALIAKGHEVGLHASFHAYNHPGYLESEAARLASVRLSGARPPEGITGIQASAPPEGGADPLIGRPVSNRTHYLRFDFPGTPRFLSSSGLVIDSSLGFPDLSGFRNGTCLPFEIWDHELNAGSGVWELPLAMMESALFNRVGLSPEQAVDETRELIQTVSRFGGILVALWHNVLWDEPDFEGWGEHFEATIQMARDGNAAILPMRDALAGWH